MSSSQEARVLWETVAMSARISSCSLYTPGLKKKPTDNKEQTTSFHFIDHTFMRSDKEIISSGKRGIVHNVRRRSIHTQNGLPRNKMKAISYICQRWYRRLAWRWSNSPDPCERLRVHKRGRPSWWHGLKTGRPLHEPLPTHLPPPSPNDYLMSKTWLDGLSALPRIMAAMFNLCW